MIRDLIPKLVAGVELTPDEARGAMQELLEGDPTPAQAGAFLTALRIKGETPAEVAAFVEVLRPRATRVAPRSEVVVDTCGTGGDRLSTLNISTTAALVAAGAGAHVAKHGNRAVSSSCGSADVLAACGVRLDMTPAQTAHCIDEIGVGFLFAPAHHPTLARVAPVRRDLGIRTVFNLLGPMLNPAGARRQLMGVYEPEQARLAAHVLMKTGSQRALVVHGLDGLDEVSTVGETLLVEVRNGQVEERVVTPEAFGLPRSRPADLAVSGDGIEAHAQALRDVLAGTPGAHRDIVLANAAAALYVAGLAPTMAEGVTLAARSIDSGEAQRRLQRLAGYPDEAAA